MTHTITNEIGLTVTVRDAGNGNVVVAGPNGTGTFTYHGDHVGGWAFPSHRREILGHLAAQWERMGLPVPARLRDNMAVIA